MIQHLKSLNEALEKCYELSISSKEYLFRGQAGIWPVVSSLGRVKIKSKAFKNAEQEIIRFGEFMEDKEELHRYRIDLDATFAIAQHYGLKTNYIDFTTDPEIAAFFATHSNNLKKGDQCTIICLRRDAFQSRTKELQAKEELPVENDLYPEIVDINVDNLWRLQAQRGVFLYTPITEIEKLYSSCFARFQFPFDSPYSRIHVAKVYPAEKSRLEILLDQFFFIENKRVQVQRYRKFVKELKIPVTRFPDPLIEDIPEDLSWSKISKLSVKESWHDVNNDESIQIDLTADNSLNTIKQSIANKFEDVSRDKSYRWNVSIDQTAIAKTANDAFELWHGLRNQHYTDDQVIDSLSYFFFCSLTFKKELQKGDAYVHWKQKFLPLVTDLLEVEFGEADNSYTRSYASASDLFDCLRKDITDYYPCTSPHDITKLLLKNNNPRQLFNYEKFDHLYVTKMLPITKFIKHNDAVYYRISNFSFFGLA